MQTIIEFYQVCHKFLKYLFVLQEYYMYQFIYWSVKILPPCNGKLAATEEEHEIYLS